MSNLLSRPRSIRFTAVRVPGFENTRKSEQYAGMIMLLLMLLMISIVTATFSRSFLRATVSSDSYTVNYSAPTHRWRSCSAPERDAVAGGRSMRHRVNCLISIIQSVLTSTAYRSWRVRAASVWSATAVYRCEAVSRRLLVPAGTDFLLTPSNLFLAKC